MKWKLYNDSQTRTELCFNSSGVYRSIILGGVGGSSGQCDLGTILPGPMFLSALPRILLQTPTKQSPKDCFLRMLPLYQTAFLSVYFWQHHIVCYIINHTLIYRVLFLTLWGSFILCSPHGCTNLQATAQKGSLFSIFSSAPAIACPSDDVHSNRWVVVSHNGFNLHFPND